MCPIWKQLYHPKIAVAAHSHGSLYQLKVAINRTNIPADPKNDMNATESSLDDVLSSHILAAACDILGVTSTAQLLKDEFEMQATFATVAQLSDDIVNLQRFGQRKKTYGDEMHYLSQDTVALLLLWREYHDATREGDGVRVVKSVALTPADIPHDELYQLCKGGSNIFDSAGVLGFAAPENGNDVQQVREHKRDARKQHSM